MKNWYDDVEKRWEAIDCLVRKHGTYEEELAWRLCKEDLEKLGLKREKE